jgi:hypothetical protein
VFVRITAAGFPPFVVRLLHRLGVTAASTHVARSVFEIPLTILKKKNMRYCCSAAGGCAFVLFLGLK